MKVPSLGHIKPLERCQVNVGGSLERSQGAGGAEVLLAGEGSIGIIFSDVKNVIQFIFSDVMGSCTVFNMKINTKIVRQLSLVLYNKSRISLQPCGNFCRSGNC